MNLHIFLTSFIGETRAEKEAASILTAGIDTSVVFLALADEGQRLLEEPAPGMHVVRLKLLSRRLPRMFAVQILKYVEWFARVLWFCVRNRRRIRSLHPHRLSGLPPSVLAKLLLRVPLVYDAHELETEVDGVGGLEKRISRVVESLCIRFADHVLVVSDSIADWYAKRYPIPRPTVMRNVPRPTCLPQCGGGGESASLRESICLGAEELVLIYIGGLGPGRGIQRLLRVWEQVPEHMHLVFMGSGVLEPVIRDASEALGNVHWHPPVLPQQVVEYARGADALVYLIPNTCLNHYFCLPNKLFEALHAELPVIISDFPEIAKVVREHDCGWLVPDNDDEVVALLRGITREAILAKRAGCRRAAAAFQWDTEAEGMISAYRALLPQQGGC